MCYRILGSIFFMIWEYIDNERIRMKCAELMTLSKGGVTLEYIENYMTPYERNEYWATFINVKKNNIDAKL